MGQTEYYVISLELDLSFFLSFLPIGKVTSRVRVRKSIKLIINEGEGTEREKTVTVQGETDDMSCHGCPELRVTILDCYFVHELSTYYIYNV